MTPEALMAGPAGHHDEGVDAAQASIEPEALIAFHPHRDHRPAAQDEIAFARLDSREEAPRHLERQPARRGHPEPSAIRVVERHEGAVGIHRVGDAAEHELDPFLHPGGGVDDLVHVGEDAEGVVGRDGARHQAALHVLLEFGGLAGLARAPHALEQALHPLQLLERLAHLPLLQREAGGLQVGAQEEARHHVLVAARGGVHLRGGERAAQALHHLEGNVAKQLFVRVFHPVPSEGTQRTLLRIRLPLHRTDTMPPADVSGDRSRRDDPGEGRVERGERSRF